jgi:hypothetical protein
MYFPSGDSTGVTGLPVIFFMLFTCGFASEKSTYHKESFAIKTSFTLLVPHLLFSVSEFTVILNWANAIAINATKIKHIVFIECI